MSIATKKNRLSPPLMHAFRKASDDKDARVKLDLRDKVGERVIADRRSHARYAITESVLREQVKKDLENLMNSIALESTEDLARFEAARRSILNFGIPDTTHRSIDEYGVQSIEGEIGTALLNYEPRLAPGTIVVTRDSNVDPANLKIRFLIRADLICSPMNVPVEFTADVEPEDGKIAIGRL
jgi:type VI secretion system protein ImpF